VVVPLRVRNAEIKGHGVNERWFRQHNAPFAEIRAHFKQEAVAPDRHGGCVEQWTTLVATIMVERDDFGGFKACAIEALQRKLHAGSRAPMHGVENVSTEMPHKKVSWLEVPKPIPAWVFMDWIKIHQLEYPGLFVYTLTFKMNTNKIQSISPGNDVPVVKDKESRVPAGNTRRIVESITVAIVERRLMPGTKLTEQKIADIFQVSRTIVRQALNQLSREHLVVLEPARGAFVAMPSIEEARQVFEVRAMIEAAMVRQLCSRITDAQIAQLRSHLRHEEDAIKRTDVSGRTRLLADFHVLLARMLGNEVLAQWLTDLLSRSSLISLMYQSSHSAAQSREEHMHIVDALEKRDVRAAVRLMEHHISNVERNLQLDPNSLDLAVALRPR
jgi:DNA-binding GntR family transcriptional regulator